MDPEDNIVGARCGIHRCCHRDPGVDPQHLALALRSLDRNQGRSDLHELTQVGESSIPQRPDMEFVPTEFEP